MDTATMVYSTEQIKSVEEMTTENKALQEKLDIAIEILEEYANQEYWADGRYKSTGELCPEGLFYEYGYETAQEALAKIKEIK